MTMSGADRHAEMSPSWRIDWSRPPSDRVELAEHIRAVLRQDARVETVHLFGSLASSELDGFPADAMSDIDLGVDVKNATDRELYDDLEGILAAGGLRPLAKNIFSGPQGITGTYMFDGYSPFWSVDIVCIEHPLGYFIGEHGKVAEPDLNRLRARELLRWT